MNHEAWRLFATTKKLNNRHHNEPEIERFLFSELKRNQNLKVYDFHFEWLFWWTLMIVVINFQIIVIVNVLRRVLHVSHRHRLVLFVVVLRVARRQRPTDSRLSISVLVVVLMREIMKTIKNARQLSVDETKRERESMKRLNSAIETIKDYRRRHIREKLLLKAKAVVGPHFDFSKLNLTTSFAEITERGRRRSIKS